MSKTKTKTKVMTIGVLAVLTICLNQIWSSWTRLPMSVLLGAQVLMCLWTAIELGEESGASSNSTPAGGTSVPPTPPKPKARPVRVSVPGNQYGAIPDTASPSYHPAEVPPIPPAPAPIPVAPSAPTAPYVPAPAQPIQARPPEGMTPEQQVAFLLNSIPDMYNQG